MQSGADTLKWLEEQHERLKNDFSELHKSSLRPMTTKTESKDESTLKQPSHYDQNDHPFEFSELIEQHRVLQRNEHEERLVHLTSQIQMRKDAREFHDDMTHQENRFRDQIRDDLNRLIKEHNQYMEHASKLFTQDRDLIGKVNNLLVDYNSILDTLSCIKDEEQSLRLQLVLIRLRISINRLTDTSSTLEIKQMNQIQDRILHLKTDQRYQRESERSRINDQIDWILREIASTGGNDDQAYLKRASLKVELERIKLMKTSQDTGCVLDDEVQRLVDAVEEETRYKTRLEEACKYEERLKELTEQNRHLLSELTTKSEKITYRTHISSKNMPNPLPSWIAALNKISTLQASLWLSKNKSIAEKWLQVGSTCINLQSFTPETLSFLSDKEIYSVEDRRSLNDKGKASQFLSTSLDNKTGSIDDPDREKTIEGLRDEMKRLERLVEKQDEKSVEKRVPQQFVLTRETLSQLDQIDRLRLKDLIRHSEISEGERARLGSEFD